MLKVLKESMEVKFCSECGRYVDGLFPSPICICGKQVREFTGFEKLVIHMIFKNFEKLSAMEKRTLWRRITWAELLLFTPLFIFICLTAMKYMGAALPLLKYFLLSQVWVAVVGTFFMAISMVNMMITDRKTNLYKKKCIK